MKIIVAPNQYELQPGEICCFLAGGITDCPDWQKQVLNNLMEFDVRHPGQLKNLVVCNPRRDNFPIDDPNAAYEQIKWEFTWLQQMHIFSMYFTAGPSDQPICMYELGRNLCRMMQRFPDSYPERVLVSCDPKYRRSQDVSIQVKLAFDSAGNGWEPNLLEKADPLVHARQIICMHKTASAQRGQ